MISLRLILIGVVLIVGCSSVPEFKPTIPPQNAATYTEALDTCASYQIPAKRNRAGRSELERVSVLTPWIRCFETVFRKFNEGKQDRSFVSMFRSLQSVHDRADPPDEEIIDWEAFNRLIPSATSFFQRRKNHFSLEERMAIEKNLPDFAMLLAEEGAFGVTSRDEFEVDPEIVKLKQEMKENEKLATPRPVSLTGSQKDFCSNYRSYKSLVWDLEDLDRYRRVLVKNLVEKDKLLKVETRYTELKSEAGMQRSVILREYKDLRAKSVWFRYRHCLI